MVKFWLLLFVLATGCATVKSLAPIQVKAGVKLAKYLLTAEAKKQIDNICALKPSSETRQRLRTATTTDKGNRAAVLCRDELEI